MYQQLAEELRNQRNELGIKARAAARRLGVGHTTLWTWEKGENPKTGNPVRPDKSHLKDLAALYNLDYYHLLQLAGYEKPSEANTAPRNALALPTAS